jgi:amidase
MTALEIGSDIGGSLRVPASFCGVYAHKPTWGLVSQLGHVPPRPGTHAERDVNVVGPLARSARDLRLLLSLLESGPLAAKAPPADLKGLRVGLWLSEPAFVLDQAVREALESFAVELAGEGAIVAPMPSPTDARILLDAYQTLLMGAVADDLPAARLRAMRRLRPVAQIAMRLGAGPDSWAANTLACTASHAEWLAANEIRARISDRMRRIFTQIDVIMAPCAPVAAFPHDHRPFRARTLTLTDGGKAPYAAVAHWIALASACGLPATAIPAGRTPEGLPVGAQLIGPRGGDSRTLAIAEAIEARLGGFSPPPALEKR